MFSFCDYLSLIDKALTASINKWLQKINFYNFWACFAAANRAIRYKSSHFLRQAVGFPLLSLTQNGKRENSFSK